MTVGTKGTLQACSTDPLLCDSVITLSFCPLSKNRLTHCAIGSPHVFE